MHLILLLLAAEFLVMVPGGSAKNFDDGQMRIAYVEANNLEVDEAPPGSTIEAGIIAALKDDAIVISLPVVVSNVVKKAAILSLATFEECQSFLADPAADNATAPKCFVVWEQLSFTDCSTIAKCRVPGNTLCDLLGGKHTMVKSPANNHGCLNACEDFRLRIRCN